AVNNARTAKNATMVAPITKVDPTAVAKLQTITPAQQQQAAQGAREIRQVAAKRVEAESQTLGRAPLRATDAPRSVRLDLPKPPPAAAAAATPSAAPRPPPPPLPGKADRPVTTTAPAA